MNIVVTGGAGFIGYNLCSKLLSLGYGVTCVDNMDDYYDVSIKQARIDSLLLNPLFRFIPKDITGNDWSMFLTRDYDCIVHLAAKVGVRNSFEKPLEYTNTNVLGTMNVLKAAKCLNIPQVIFASSSSVYGETSGIVAESQPKNPISPYGITKSIGEDLCELSSSQGIKCTSLRFHSVYGPGQRPDLLFAKLKHCINTGDKFTLYGDGNTLRDYTHVEDIVQGILLRIWTKQTKDYECYNLGSMKPYTINEVISLFEVISKRTITAENLFLQNSDVGSTFADISKISTALHYKPNVNLKDGITHYLKHTE